MKKFVILTLLLGVLAIPSQAFLFGPNKKTFKGVVNFIQPTNFTLMTPQNTLLRVIVPQDKSVPTNVMVGTVVEVKCVEGEDKQWYLDEFKKIESLPGRDPNN